MELRKPQGKPASRTDEQRVGHDRMTLFPDQAEVLLKGEGIRIGSYPAFQLGVTVGLIGLDSDRLWRTWE